MSKARRKSTARQGHQIVSGLIARGIDCSVEDLAKCNKHFQRRILESLKDEYQFFKSQLHSENYFDEIQKIFDESSDTIGSHVDDGFREFIVCEELSEFLHFAGVEVRAMELGLLSKEEFEDCLSKCLAFLKIYDGVKTDLLEQPSVAKTEAIIKKVEEAEAQLVLRKTEIEEATKLRDANSSKVSEIKNTINAIERKLSEKLAQSKFTEEEIARSGEFLSNLLQDTAKKMTSATENSRGQKLLRTKLLSTDETRKFLKEKEKTASAFKETKRSFEEKENESKVLDSYISSLQESHHLMEQKTKELEDMAETLRKRKKAIADLNEEQHELKEIEKRDKDGVNIYKQQKKKLADIGREKKKASDEKTNRWKTKITEAKTAKAIAAASVKELAEGVAMKESELSRLQKDIQIHETDHKKILAAKNRCLAKIAQDKENRTQQCKAVWDDRHKILQKVSARFLQ